MFCNLNSSVVSGICFPQTTIRVGIPPPQSCDGGGGHGAAGKNARRWQSRAPSNLAAVEVSLRCCPHTAKEKLRRLDNFGVVDEKGHVSDVAGDDALPSPRRIFLRSAALLAPVVVLGISMNHAVALESEASESISKAANVTGIKPSVSPSANEVRKPIMETESWYRFRGDGFAIKVPPEFEDIVEPDEGGNSLYGERAKEKPFAARFASPDRQEVLSVVVRPASQLRLSFFETQDISEFGSLKEVAGIFVPAGSKILSARIINSADTRVPRKYYLYEFVSKDKHVAMSAGAAAGRVYVVGAMAPQSRWKDVGKTLRSAAASFSIL